MHAFSFDCILYICYFIMIILINHETIINSVFKLKKKTPLFNKNIMWPIFWHFLYLQVAPNVSLQRSSSVPESQLSPSYVNQLGQQQGQRLNNQQQPYSPHSQMPSPLGQQAGFPQTTIGNYQQANSRLSPHPPFSQQLSPRQGYPQANSQNNAAWSQQQARLSVQQQQNPMLNAQLTVSILFVWFFREKY